MSLTPAQRERMAADRTLAGYETAVAMASGYGWPARIAHKMGRAVVRRMRKGDTQEFAIAKEVVRKPERVQ